MDQSDITRLMAESLAEGLSTLRNRAVDVQSVVVRARFEASSSFATQRLRVLADGEWLDVFLKDLNPLHQLVHARAIRETALERSRRELHVYKNVLRGGLCGTPMLYGSRWEPGKGLLWLFLEDVGSRHQRLKKLGDLSLWVAAARWAARFHASARSLPADTLTPLPQLEAMNYASCADQLGENLSRYPAENRGAIQSALNVYRDVIGQLERLPRGLIHNEFFGTNVVVRPAPAAERIAVIDWETAAIGLNYLDLISISAGRRWTEEQRLQMWRGYFQQAQIESGASLSWRTFCDDLHCVALYQCLHWLNWWSSGGDVHVRRWLAELDRVLVDFRPSAPAGSGPSAQSVIHGCVE